MGTQNHALKFSSKVQESFKKGAFTNNAVNHDYDFIGVKSVKIYSVDTAPMTNYAAGRDGGTKDRYGTPTDIGTSVQELQLKIDRSFTFVIDKRDNMDQMDVLNPGKALQRQIEDRVIPEVDKYRLAAIVNGADHRSSKKVNRVAITKENAYEKFLEAKINLMNDNVPMNGCVAYISTNFYKQIRLDANFIKPSDIAQNMLVKGQVGEIDGIPLILVPDSYFPRHSSHSSGGSAAVWSNLDQINTVLGNANSKVEFILTNSAAVVGVEKLTDYKVHDNPPGINGYLVEGRICYDAFVLDKKKDMIFVQCTPS